MKARVLSALLLLAFAQGASAGVHDMAGCGLGSLIFKNNIKGEQILAVTTNNLTFTQTFGISSETLGCTKDGVVQADKKRALYAEVNLQSLSRELAQGRGEFLDAFAALSGCRERASRDAFARFAQERYGKLFPDERTDAAAFLRNVDTELASSAALAKACAS